MTAGKELQRLTERDRRAEKRRAPLGITVGIPRALLFHHYEKFWTTFFNEAGINYLISPETNKEIVTAGANLAIDETCLPTKILLGQVNWLLGKCDYVFLPHVEALHRVSMCTKCMSQTDLVANTFRDREPQLLYYNLNSMNPQVEYKRYLEMGKFLGLKKSVTKNAYFTAQRAQQYFEFYRDQEQQKLLRESKQNKVLVVAHPYNIYDQFVGAPILRTLRELDCTPIIASDLDYATCAKNADAISSTVPWVFSKQLIGAIATYRDQVDGIVIVTTFPCGPDSMVNEMIVRRVKDKPILVLTIDTQDGTAGMETRLESFVDILNFQKERAFRGGAIAPATLPTPPAARSTTRTKPKTKSTKGNPHE